MRSHAGLADAQSARGLRHPSEFDNGEQHAKLAGRQVECLSCRQTAKKAALGELEDLPKSSILRLTIRLGCEGAQLGRLALKLIEPHVQDITDADHTNEAVAVGYWDVTDTS